MLIDTTKLDNKKTYHCNEVGIGKIAKILQKLQHSKYPEIPLNDIADHSFLLIPRETGWNVWECHIRWKGIKEYTLEDYEKLKLKSTTKKVLINQYDFDLDAADYWRNNNPGYSVLDLGKIATKRLTGIKLPNSPGMVCSESAANLGFKICNRLGLKSEFIAPVDWQYYFSLK